MIDQRQEFSDDAWIDEFTRQNSYAMSVFTDANITDDASYIEGECFLPADVRRDAGLVRFHTLIKSGRADDPCDVARCAPPWLSKQPLSDLRTVPATLLRHNIVHVSDLATTSIADLRRLPSMQFKSTYIIASVLYARIVRGPDPVGAKLADSKRSRPVTVKQPRIGNQNVDIQAASQKVDDARTLVESLWIALSFLKTRDATILASRLGLNGSIPTLEALAEIHGVTRERVRQIEARSFQYIKYLGSWQARFQSSISAMSRRSQQPVFVYALDLEDDWFSFDVCHSFVLEELLARLCKDVFIIEISAGVKAITSIDEATWRATVERARSLLTEASDSSSAWSFDECKAMTVTLLETVAPALAEALWSFVSADAHFVNDINENSQPYLVSYGKSVSAIVDAVLAESLEPLHYRDITKRVEQIHRRRVDEKYVHNILVERALQLGPGRYGTAAHLTLSPTERSQLATWLQDRVQAEPGKQWSCFELLPLSRRLEFGDRLSIYMLDVAFRDVEGMIDLGRFCWASEALASSSGAIDRIDIAQAVEAILIESGSPLSAVDIRDRLSSERGIQNIQQILPSDRVFRLGRAQWGLIARDSGLSVRERDTYLNELSDALVQSSAALYVREICLHFTNVSNVTCLTENEREALSWIIFGLAQCDERFKTTTADFVYLATWEGPRRLSVSAAVRIVAETIPTDGESIRSLRRRVYGVLGRQCDANKMYGALRDVASWDSKTNLWFRI